MPDDTHDGEATRYNVPALEKGLDVCELLAGEPTGLNVTEIAQRLGRSTGELYRLIQYLERRGYLDREDKGDRYALSLRMFRLSHDHPPIRSLASHAIPQMELLAAAIGQSCHLAVLDRASIVIVAQVDSPLPIRYSVRLGAQFPVWQTSSGLLIGGCLEGEARTRLLDALARLVDADELDRFKARTAEIRLRGFEERPSELVPDIVNLSRPVRGLNGGVVGALTVPFLEQRSGQVARVEASAALAAAAALISAGLGHRDRDERACA